MSREICFAVVASPTGVWPAREEDVRVLYADVTTSSDVAAKFREVDGLQHCRPIFMQAHGRHRQLVWQPFNNVQALPEDPLRVILLEPQNPGRTTEDTPLGRMAASLLTAIHEVNRGVNRVLGVVEKPVRIAASVANSRDLELMTSYCKLDQIASEAKTFRCCFSELQDTLEAILDGLQSMVWEGQNETDGDNMKNAADVWEKWLGDSEVWVVAVEGAPWIEITTQVFSMTGSKCDLVALDRPLLESLLQPQELQQLEEGRPGRNVVQKAAQAILMAFETKHTRQLRGTSWSVRRQCVAELIGINMSNGTFNNEELIWGAGEAPVWGGSLKLSDTIGVHTVVTADGRRHLHTTQFGSSTQPILIAAMRQLLKLAKEGRRARLGYSPETPEGRMEVDAAAGVGSDSTAGNSSSGHADANRTSGNIAAAAGSAGFSGQLNHNTLRSLAGLSAMAAAEQWVAQHCGSDSQPPVIDEDRYVSIEEELTILKDYLDPAAYNAQWQQGMKESVNQPNVLRYLTEQDEPLPDHVFAKMDAYGWGVKLVKAIAHRYEAEGLLPERPVTC